MTSFGDHFSWHPGVRTTTIRERSEEDLARLVPRWKSIYHAEEWPEEFRFAPRSGRPSRAG